MLGIEIPNFGRRWSGMMICAIFSILATWLKKQLICKELTILATLVQKQLTVENPTWINGAFSRIVSLWLCSWSLGARNIDQSVKNQILSWRCHSKANTFQLRMSLAQCCNALKLLKARHVFHSAGARFAPTQMASGKSFVGGFARKQVRKHSPKSI